MRQIIAVEAKSSARGSDLYMVLGCSDTAVFNAIGHRRGRPFRPHGQRPLLLALADTLAFQFGFHIAHQ
jgi:hypothetical protein